MNSTHGFTGLSDTAKQLLIAVGISSFMRAWSFDRTGLSTLSGAMYYVRRDSSTLCDIMLHALNGSEPHRARLREFLEDDVCEEIATAFHPGNSIDWSHNEST